MSTYTVFPIEPPVSLSQLTAYKTLRLTSLQIDPQAFVSSYAREAAFSEDVWRERVDSPGKQTLVASVLQDASHEASERNTNGTVDGNDDSDKVRAGEAGEWIGTASIVAPSSLPPSFLAPLKESGAGANWEIYALFAMWVHPAHRGKGVGTQLVRACLEWARTNVDVKFLNGSGNSGHSEKVMVLLVYSDNVAGRGFYSRAGFIDLEGVPAKEGEMWMLARV